MKYRHIKEKLGIGCNKLIQSKEGSNYENHCNSGYQLCEDCFGKSIMFDRYLELIKQKAQLDFIELLNHNKRKIFIDETRDINEIFLDLKGLKSLVKELKNG